MAYEWRRLPDAPFSERDGAMAVVSDFGSGGAALPYLLGGWNTDEPDNFTKDRTNEVWRADDIEKGIWTRMRKASQWSPRHTAGCEQDSTGTIHIFGADAQDGRYVNDHWSAAGLTPTTIWRLEEDAIPWGNRILGISGYYGGKVLYIGGQSIPSLIGPYHALELHTDIWGFDPTNRAAGWSQQLANCPALPRGGVDHAVPFGGHLYLYGGGEYGTTTHDSEVWRTTVAGSVASWELLATAPWNGRIYSNALPWDGKLWHMFGIGGPSGGVHDNLSDAWYSADGVTWTELTGTMPPARHAASAFVYNNSIIVMCGSDFEQGPRKDVWQLRIV